jgi:hypothetical protein
MKTLILLSILISSFSSFANETAEFKSLDCTDQDGTSLILVQQLGGAYNLEYAGTIQVPLYGQYKITPIVISKGLQCKGSSSAMTTIECSAVEEQMIAAPRSGKDPQKVLRTSHFSVGMKWENILEANSTGNSQKHLTLEATFTVPVYVGEVIEKIQFEGIKQDGEKRMFTLDKSLIQMPIGGDDQSGCTMSF